MHHETLYGIGRYFIGSFGTGGYDMIKKWSSFRKIMKKHGFDKMKPIDELMKLNIKDVDKIRQWRIDHDYLTQYFRDNRNHKFLIDLLYQNKDDLEIVKTLMRYLITEFPKGEFK